MYIGETATPVHLIEEALDNSLDECLAGFANIVAINLDTKNHIYQVIDNGRGIPISKDIPRLISSKLFSGAKFQGIKTAYDICSGRHGVGLVAINALSDLYKVEIYRNSKRAVFEFEKAKFRRKEIKAFSGQKPFSTLVQFRPDKTIFESLVPDIQRIRNRLLIASVELSKCTFALSVDGNREVIKLDMQEYFMKHCLKDSDKEISPIIDINPGMIPENFKVKFCFSRNGTTTPKVHTSVNLLPVEGGGIHINVFYDILKDMFMSRAKKLGLKFQPNDCLCGLRAYLSLSLKNPEFSGQIKYRLTNSKNDLLKLTNPLKQKIEQYFDKNQNLLELLLEQFELYRRKIDSKKLRNFTNGKRASTKFTKLRDCTDNKGELFIVEGDSAGGSFIACRDPRRHAIFPLRGKIPSIVNAKDILKNKEVGELIQALGTGVGPHFDISGLKYEKVICATDADEDGGHIFCLLTIILANLVPDVIKNGHYYLVQTPLYAMTEGKQFVPLWTEKQIQKVREKKKKISRFKGLGELNPDQLKVCAIDEKTRKLIPIRFSDNLDEIMKLFSDVNTKRKLLNMEGKHDKES
jgi:DNA gyrase subunit B